MKPILWSPRADHWRASRGGHDGCALQHCCTSALQAVCQKGWEEGSSGRKEDFLVGDSKCSICASTPSVSSGYEMSCFHVCSFRNAFKSYPPSTQKGVRVAVTKWCDSLPGSLVGPAPLCAWPVQQCELARLVSLVRSGYYGLLWTRGTLKPVLSVESNPHPEPW